MKRLRWIVVPAAALAACVSVAPIPEPHGVYKPGQRLVVMMYQCPGPWIESGEDTNVEGALKITPLGFAMQGLQDQRTLSISKDLQQYLPRPPYGVEVQEALLAELKTVLSTSAVQTGLEAGIAPSQIQLWNRAKDQLDWRRRYYAPDPDLPAPRDYNTRSFGLDDALILDVNLTFGTKGAEGGKLLPNLTAAWRVYRGPDPHPVWEHVEEAADQTSSSTLTDFRVDPPDLSRRLEGMTSALGKSVAREFVRVFAIGPSVRPLTPVPGGAPSGGGGLLPMDYLLSLSSKTAAGQVSVSTPTAAPVFLSTSAPAAVSLSTSPAAAVKPAPGAASP